VAADFQVPEVLEIVKRGIMWAARQPIIAEYVSPVKKARGTKA
jgi:type 1 glutamine amidotransferase